MFAQSVRWLRWMPALALVLFALLIAGPALAQSNGGSAEVELIGVIEAMDTQTITVNGQIVNVARAEIRTALSVGLAVEVEGWLLVDGSVLAREVYAVQAGIQPGEVEVIGAVESLGSAALVVNGLTFDVSAAEMPGGTPAVGDRVKVHASLSADGRWIAREVERFVDNSTSGAAPVGEVEITGTLTEIGTDFIVVSGQTIGTVGAEIKDTLVIGALVKVHMSVVSGQWVAHEVELARLGDSAANLMIPANCAPAQPAGWISYTVQRGDTLSSIAARSGSSVQELTAINCIVNPRIIRAGTVLFVPRTPSPAPAVGNDNTSSNSNDNFSSPGNDNRDDDYSGNDNRSDDHSNDNRSDDHSNNNHSDDRGDDNHDDDDDD